MSDSMFGERYFATRERLSAVMRGIAALAGETGTPLGPEWAPGEFGKGIASPYLFVVCGETNAGKSTLVNGLFGHDLCRVSNLPETNRVIHYRHGQVNREHAAGSGLEERQRPAPFLRDFHVLDTPGTNSRDPAALEPVDAFLGSAELILLVFPVTNPWEAASWNFISRIPRTNIDRLVLVVQKADQREPGDLQVILGHMSDLALKRLGRVPPMFAVSGKLAREARQSTPTNHRTLKASGISDLESYITFHICESPTRRRALESWRAQGATALRAIDDHIEDQSRELNIQGRFLDTLEREIDDMRERFVARLPVHLGSVAEVFETEAVWVSRRLRRRLGAIRSFCRLFAGDRTGIAMETVFVERLQAAVEAVAEKDGLEVAEFCRAHWIPLGERVKAATGVELGRREALDELLDTARTRFVQRLGAAARAGIGSLKVRNQLEHDLRNRNRALKSFLFMTLLLISAGATCGALAIPLAPLILCGLATVFLLGGCLAAIATRKAITADFQQRLLATCGGFASTLRSDYEEALRLVFQDYATSLIAVRSHLAHEKRALEPRLRRWQHLFLTLKAIEQDL